MADAVLFIVAFSSHARGPELGPGSLAHPVREATPRRPSRLPPARGVTLPLRGPRHLGRGVACRARANGVHRRRTGGPDRHAWEDTVQADAFTSDIKLVNVKNGLFSLLSPSWILIPSTPQKALRALFLPNHAMEVPRAHPLWMAHCHARRRALPALLHFDLQPGPQRRDRRRSVPHARAGA